MQPEYFILWVFAGVFGTMVIVVGIQDLYKHWNKCRHNWTAWSTPEKPETNYYAPSYGYQTRCCKICNEFEIRQIK